MKSERSIAVLTSGKSRGSNFTALYQWFRENHKPVKIAFLTVNNPESPVVEICKELGVLCLYLPTKEMAEFERKLLSYLQEHNIELIALAGFLRKLSADFIVGCGVPILNIHPALLPKYGGKGMYGMNVHKAILAAGEKESGVTVHLVDENYDTGKIIAQERVVIEDCTTPEEIAARVLTLEHQFYAPAILTLLGNNSVSKQQLQRDFIKDEK